MRIVLAVLVMWWVVNLIFAMATRDPLGIGLGVLYLSACAYGLFVRGIVLGLIAWIAIAIGLEALFFMTLHQHVPGLLLGGVLFWSGLALLAGNLFRRE
jgi:hypothetical protein